uniref:Uncharacterized protein n=1 Tax=Romanomermis culicivorax TaxID=13658 RepID=A0A915K4W6_ROMCU
MRSPLEEDANIMQYYVANALITNAYGRLDRPRFHSGACAIIIGRKIAPIAQTPANTSETTSALRTLVVDDARITHGQLPGKTFALMLDRRALTNVAISNANLSRVVVHVRGVADVGFEILSTLATFICALHTVSAVALLVYFAWTVEERPTAYEGIVGDLKSNRIVFLKNMSNWIPINRPRLRKFENAHRHPDTRLGDTPIDLNAYGLMTQMLK